MAEQRTCRHGIGRQQRVETCERVEEEMRLDLCLQHLELRRHGGSLRLFRATTALDVQHIEDGETAADEREHHADQRVFRLLSGEPISNRHADQEPERDRRNVG